MSQKHLHPQDAMMEYLHSLLPVQPVSVKKDNQPSLPVKTGNPVNISNHSPNKTDNFTRSDNALHHQDSSLNLSADDSALYRSYKQSIAHQRQSEKQRQWPEQSITVREPIAFNPTSFLPQSIPIAQKEKKAVRADVVLSPKLTERQRERLTKARARHQQRIAARALKQKLVKEQSSPSVSEGWSSNGRPDWGQAHFECLLFTVAGLKLAVPLVTLGAIHTIDKDLTPIVGRPEWYLGMFALHDDNINVVDTAQWVMPERVSHQVTATYKYAIRLDDTDWAIGCHSVEQSIRLSPDDVKWRTQRTKRPWLAGTVIEHMCALMDVQALCKLFQQTSIKNSKS